ncbi:MAG: glycosyltransferase family 39 protein [Candidatus Aminicenantes bacterium]|nr:glycosyltransferase family 39 protein [Candidatus Aminicenantes bacterium]
MPSSPKNARVAVFLLILVLAAAVRFWGIGWGLPHTYHVDENWFGGKAMQFLEGDLNPHFFHVPTLHMYALAGLWKGYYEIEKAAGNVRTTAEFRETYTQSPEVFFLIGRALTALMGLGTVLLLYLLGKRMFGPRAGAIAALLLVFGLDHARMSHDMLPDVPMVFFLVLAFLSTWNIAEKGRTRDYLWAGVAAGLAMTTKYGGLLLFIPIFLAHIYRVRETKRPAREYIFSPRLIGSGLVFLAVFVLGSPYVVLDFPKFLKDFKWQSSHLTEEGHFGDSSAHSALLFYLRHGFAENIGIVSQFLVLGGFFLVLFRRQKRDLVLLSYPLVQFAMVSLWGTRATRYLLPLAPFFALIGAVFLDRLLARGDRKFAPDGANQERRTVWAVVSCLLIAAIIAPSAIRLGKLDAALAGPDSRTRAKEWIEYNIPKGARIAMEMYGPPISRQDYIVFYNHTLSKTDMEYLSFMGVEYAVISDTMAGRFTRFPQDFPKEAAFYAELARDATLVKTIEPGFREPLLEIHMPKIEIYKLSRAPAQGFPVNFRSYVQNVTLARTGAGSWEIRSAIAAAGGLGVREQAANPYVKISDAGGRELTRVVLRPGPVSSEGPWTSAVSGLVPDIPEGAVVDLGYDYVPAPSSIAYEPEQPLHKEFRLPGMMDPASLKVGRWSGGFWFAAIPGPGGYHFQTVAAVPRDGGVFVQSRVFGPALRYGNGRIENPFVLIKDAAGNEIKKITIFSGRLGAFEADGKGPAQNSAGLAGLPPGFRMFIGHDDGATRLSPEKSAGPYLLEFPPLPAPAGPKSQM